MTPDLGRLTQDLISVGSRAARHLPGTVGGMGVYFSARAAMDREGRDHPWEADRDRLLGLADAALGSGRIDAALSWYDKALRTAYHPAVHSGGASPLVADPDAFLEPLRRSTTGEQLLQQRIAPGSAPQRPAPRERTDGDPVRVVVIAQANWTFIRPLLDALSATGRFEILEIEVDDLPADEGPDRDRVLRGRYDLVTSGARMPTPPRLAEAYDWADVALVEWGHHVLTWVTLLDRAPRRLVARYHRFEAFTPFPLLHDHGRIDLVLHVSPPVRTLLDRIVPAQRERPVQIVGNLLSRGIGEVSSLDRDTRLLVQVGWNREIKDVLFSLDVLEALRREDPRFRLELVGAGLPDRPSHDTAYQSAVRERLAAMPAGTVEQLGVRSDVPAILGAAGAVLSSSQGEGTHESVMEGLATGCPAVVRDWPDAVDYGGAASVYQRDWVVADVEEAVERVLALQDPERFAEESRAARGFAEAERDPDTVLAGYERALAPDDEAR